MYVLYIYNIIYLYMDNIYIYIIYTYYLQVHLHHLPWADGSAALEAIEFYGSQICGWQRCEDLAMDQ